MKRMLILILALVAIAPTLAHAQVEPQKVSVVDPAGASVYPFGSIAIGTSSSGVRVGTVGCYVNTSDPTYTNAQIHPLSCTTTGALRILGQVSLANGGVVSVSDITGTIVLPAGAATSAKQPALGTAGTPSADYLSVQGSGTMTPLEVYLTDTSGAPLALAADVTEDSPETAGVGGPMVLNVRRDTAASSAGTAGDNATFNSDELGQLWTRQLDPCGGKPKSYHVVNMNTATTVEIANAVASQFFYICSVNLVASAAQTIAIGEDDTDGCGSITAGLHGGATAATGWSFAANGGITLGNGMGTVMKTGTANRYLCVITGQAVQVSGTIAYVSAP